MAKKLPHAFEKIVLNRADLCASRIDKIYQSMIREVTDVVASANLDANVQFSWAKYPETRKRIDKLTKQLYQQVYDTINDFTEQEWNVATKATDKIVDNFFSKKGLENFRAAKYYQRNEKALEAFQKRKLGGLNLSDRIWNQSKQFKVEIEQCIGVGLSDGRSAQELSRDIRKYLLEPDKLFRRLKDPESGVMRLSKRAREYTPKTGVYRSSYKNAMRVARTEVNMAYRTADNERWQQLDFVVGFEVRRSNNVYSCNVCESLAGRYPKSFVFKSWHPQCRCFAIPILATSEEFIEYMEKKLAGSEDASLVSKNEVLELPDNFKNWINDNAERLDAAKTKPYFIVENKSVIDELIDSQKIGSNVKYGSVDDLPERLRKELVEYSSNTSYHVNYYLREGKYFRPSDTVMIEKINDNIKALDEVFDSTKQTEGVYYRGLFFQKDELGAFMSNMKEGATFKDKGYLSTSITKSVVEDGYNGSVILEIKGKALDIRSVSLVRGEDEFLMNRSLEFRITKIREESGRFFISLVEM